MNCVNVSHRTNDSGVDLHFATCAFERATGRVHDVAAFADWRIAAHQGELAKCPTGPHTDEANAANIGAKGAQGFIDGIQTGGLLN